MDMKKKKKHLMDDPRLQEALGVPAKPSSYPVGMPTLGSLKLPPELLKRLRKKDVK